MNTSVGNTSAGEEEHTLYGKSTIAETLRGLTFQISANSFFQTNTWQVSTHDQFSVLLTSFHFSCKNLVFFSCSLGKSLRLGALQAEVLYKLIEECAGLRGNGSEIVLDLFCGTGTIGLTLARRYRYLSLVIIM